MAIIGGLAVVATSVAILGNRATEKRSSDLEAERSLTQTRHGRIEYISWGEGPPVLVIHGAGGGFDQGRLLAMALGGTSSQFVSVSRFGYLGSELPANPSTAAQAEALLDLLDHLDIEKATILAMSGGVPPALKFAEMFPDRTERMVLLSSAPLTPFSPKVEDRPIPTWAYTSLLGNDAAYWALTKGARGPLRSAFDARADLMVDISADELWFVDHLIDGFLPASARLAGVENEGAAVDPLAVYRLNGIRAPTLIVHARDDSLNPVEIGIELASRIPEAQQVIFERGGHLLLGHHAELRDRIGRFLANEQSPQTKRITTDSGAIFWFSFSERML
ncbi:alpha/beta hydrolase [Parasphingorhabdus sp.]|uniref:alpha/beta fold hydrolase n=1 Tax=Parasphingorhabdus sp. TaxID=2709688 RepID=UPI0032EB85C8